MSEKQPGVINLMQIKPRMLVFGLYAVFLILLFFSTDIILFLHQKEMYHLKSVDFSQYQAVLKQFDAKVEAFSENKDIQFTVEFLGYAFIPTSEESDTKAVKLVFVSEENSYETDAEVVERFNLRNLFQEKNIIGIKHGYITRFSPLKMKNGIYKLYLYCYENEEVMGIVDMNMVFEKTYRSFQKITQ